jgi:hypothetical protein
MTMTITYRPLGRSYLDNAELPDMLKKEERYICPIRSTIQHDLLWNRKEPKHLANTSRRRAAV